MVFGDASCHSPEFFRDAELGTVERRHSIVIRQICRSSNVFEFRSRALVTYRRARGDGNERCYKHPPLTVGQTCCLSSSSTSTSPAVDCSVEMSALISYEPTAAKEAPRCQHALPRGRIRDDFFRFCLAEWATHLRLFLTLLFFTSSHLHLVHLPSTSHTFLPLFNFDFRSSNVSEWMIQGGTHGVEPQRYVFIKH